MLKHKRLYKYVPFSEYSLLNLKNGTFWFSHPSKFNDPFDCKLRYGYRKEDGAFFDAVLSRLRAKTATVPNPNLDAALEILLRRPDPHFSMLRDFIEDFRLFDQSDWDWARGENSIHRHYSQFERIEKQLGVLCFSMKGNHTLMWSHYTTNHTGFCIEYAVDWVALPKYEMHSIDVKYESEMPDIIWIDNLADRHDFFAKLDVQVGHKYIEWKYEEEVRIISRKTNCPQVVPGEISSIIFGMKMPPDKREQVKKLVSSIAPKASFKEVGYEDGKYELGVG